VRKWLFVILLLPEAILAFVASVFVHRLVTVELGHQLSPVGFLLLISLSGGVAMSGLMNLSMRFLGLRAVRRDGRIVFVSSLEAEDQGGGQP
jgi:hypothetical protein